MRTAFISDIHANLEALDVVLADARAQGADRLVCLGDIVGYGPDPNVCAHQVQDACAVTVIGNHDYAALGLLETSGFNEYARFASEWTSRALDAKTRGFLIALPLTAQVDGLYAVHSSPLDPEQWTYVLSFEEARRQFPAFAERLCFIGHSHLPILIQHDGDDVCPIVLPENSALTLEPESRYMVNVGSVGQPRDRDPRSSYLIYDASTDAVTLRRVPYPVEVVQDKILLRGLPPFLAQRLAAGV